MTARALLGSVGVFCLVLTVSSLTARERGEYARGDANFSATVDLSDAVFMLQRLFRGGPPPVCRSIADANATGTFDIGDPIFLLGVIFRGRGQLSELTPQEIDSCEQERLFDCGERQFFERDPAGNTYSCSSCHTTDVPFTATPSEGAILPAHGLGGVVSRPSYFNGATSDLLEAINHCRADWMDAPPLLEEDEAYQSQRIYLESLWPQGVPASALHYDIVHPIATGPSQGDPLRGCKLFERTCESCHGSLGLGAIAPSIWSSSPSPFALRQRIRLSGPDAALVPDTLHAGLLGNRMPFWSAQRLSDAQVEDLVAYLSVGDDPSRRACDDVIQPPRILSGGTFQTILHGVRGTAEHWTDGKIRLTGFYYDGGGPLEVLVWLYLKDPDNFHAILGGIRISSHLARDVPYQDVDLEFDIPDGVTRDMFNTVSIWCTEFQTNYGEAELEE